MFLKLQTLALKNFIDYILRIQIKPQQILQLEKISEDEYTLFDPISTWKKKKITNYYIKNLQEKIFENGKLVYNSPDVKNIAEYSKNDLDSFWEEIKRIDNPPKYFVDLSEKLYDLKQEMLRK